MRFGYKLCSEERTAAELVADAEGAEAAGFDLAAVSDHFHPWLDAQGQSPFAWTVLGAIARATERLTVGTMVTCPTMRLHPAIVAQAAATTATLLPGRWFLGVGTGERLNEHVVGGDWPEPDDRRAMLRDAIVMIRRLWSGDETSYEGEYLQVEAARLYSLPDEPPPLYVAASGEGAATLAAELGDGLITTAPDTALVDAFRSAEGEGPVLGEVTACWGMPEDDAFDELRRRWPLPGIRGRCEHGPVAARRLREGRPRRDRRRPPRQGRDGRGPVGVRRAGARVRRRGLHPRGPASGRDRTGGVPAFRRTRVPAGAAGGVRGGQRPVGPAGGRRSDSSEVRSSSASGSVRSDGSLPGRGDSRLDHPADERADQSQAERAGQRAGDSRRSRRRRSSRRSGRSRLLARHR